MLLQNKNIYKRKKHAQQSVIQDEAHWEALLFLARVLLSVNKASEALIFATKATKTAPQCEGADNLLQSCSNKIKNLHLKQGNNQRQQENFEGAITSYQKVIELAPKHSQAHMHLGTVLKQQGKIEEAIVVYQQAVKLKSQPHIYYVLGNAQHQQGKLEEAITSYRKALELKPQNPFNIYRALGKVLVQTGSVKEAIAAYQKALELKPDSLTISRSLKNLEQQLKF